MTRQTIFPLPDSPDPGPPDPGRQNAPGGADSRSLNLPLNLPDRPPDSRPHDLWPETPPEKTPDPAGEMRELIARGVLGETLAGRVAIRRDGTWFFARGYFSDPETNRALMDLAGRGLIPPGRAKHVVTLEALHQLYRDADEGGADRAVFAAPPALIARLNRLLAQCVALEASDVMLVIRSERAQWSVLVHDRMEPAGDPWTAEDGRAAMRSFFYAAGAGYGNDAAGGDIKSYKCDTARAGHAGLVLPGGLSGLRISTAGNEPGDGVHLMARLFYRRHSTRDFTLGDIVADRQDYAVLARAMRVRKGAVLLVGGTGDGKSTTGLKYIEEILRRHQGRLHIVQIGNPVEQLNPGLLQISVEDSAAREAAYVDHLRHSMRIHPHMIYLEEIRDIEAARLFYSYVLSGHPGVSTLHAGSASGAAFRLMTLGMSPEEVANPDFLALIWRQTLVWELCPDCAHPVDETTLPDAGLRADLARRGLLAGARMRHPKGCPSCRRADGLSASFWNGYRRVIAVCEWLRPDAGWRARVRARDGEAARAWWRTRHQPLTLSARLCALVAQGRIDPLQAAARGAFEEEDKEQENAALRERPFEGPPPNPASTAQNDGTADRRADTPQAPPGASPAPQPPDTEDTDEIS